MSFLANLCCGGFVNNPKCDTVIMGMYRDWGYVTKSHPALSIITNMVHTRFIVRMTISNVCSQIMNEVQGTHKIQVNNSTIRNRWREDSLSSRYPLRCEPLSIGNRTSPSYWARQRENWKKINGLRLCSQTRRIVSGFHKVTVGLLLKT